MAILQPEQLDDFLTIRELDLTKLQAAVERLRQAKPVPMRGDKLASVLAEGLAEERGAADSIARQALMLYSGILFGGLTVEQVQAVIREEVKTVFEWKDKDIEKWQQIEPALGELLSLPALRLAANVINLSQEYTNLWRASRIFTDIRPIFSEDAATIDGAIVSHAFRLHYQSVDGAHELNLAMGEADIRALTEQCERALQKAQTARSLMRDNAKVPTIISGESENA
jgi:hypothetical protein